MGIGYTPLPPPPPKGPVITDLLDQEQILLLVMLLTEVIDDTGYGKVTVSVYDKRVLQMHAAKTFRRSAR